MQDSFAIEVQDHKKNFTENLDDDSTDIIQDILAKKYSCNNSPLKVLFSAHTIFCTIYFHNNLNLFKYHYIHIITAIGFTSLGIFLVIFLLFSRDENFNFGIINSAF